MATGTIEDIKAALDVLVGFTGYHLPHEAPMVEGAETTMRDAVAELERLRNIVQQIAKDEPTYEGHMGDSYCIYCNYVEYDQGHEEGCKWISACEAVKLMPQ